MSRAGVKTSKPPARQAKQRLNGRGDAHATRLLRSLRERIARQEIPPGARLREQALATEFHVGRTRVREAFSALEQRGLVARIPNRGAVVARLGLNEIFHLYEVREVLEGLAVRLAAQNAPPESWQDLVDYFDVPMGEHVRLREIDAFIAGYERFRRRALDSAGNPVLAQMLDSIYDRTQVVIQRVIMLPGRAETGLAQHRAVLNAMHRGDAEQAEIMRRENMRSAKQWFQRYHKYVL
jgi:DNA-binding GntR family transcriptional regulator